ncbi:ovomucoid-like isoform X1 [Phaenicophaeus curvirostris]|uniref:ovomucoid-like isoform X1 n=1 Tax=Phaenicophaeus curvirostris TaxID=33595 RepID=UPI0037F0B4F0
MVREMCIYIVWREKAENHLLNSTVTDLQVTDYKILSAMKTRSSIALLGLVLLGFLSDTVVAQQRASCSMYHWSGKIQHACPRNYQPVCGTNGVTYPNECSLCEEIFRNRAIDKKHDGRCVKLDCTGYLRSTDDDVTCTMEYQPFCGTNGVTYRNKCHFCSTVANGLDVNLHNVGECFQQIDCSEQEGNKLLCTAIYNPLCGSDSRTYMNKCQFCRAVLRSRGTLFLRHHGEC